MGWLDTVGGLPPPAFPADTGISPPYAAKYSLGAPPSCGDAVCNGTETKCTCAADCGAAPATESTCNDTLDEDCDGLTDCADADCAGALSCSSSCGDSLCSPGESCSTCAADCASVTGGQPSKRYCCGDGIMQTPEGDGTICDGNY